MGLLKKDYTFYEGVKIWVTLSTMCAIAPIYFVVDLTRDLIANPLIAKK